MMSQFGPLGVKCLRDIQMKVFKRKLEKKKKKEVGLSCPIQEARAGI